MPARTLSVVMPALNEATNIAAAVEEATRALHGRVDAYELLLVNDGSHDGTGKMMEALARTDPRIRVTHNAQSRNLGGVLQQGVAMASYDYFTWIPGDNENPREALVRPLEAIGSADIIIPYTVNQRARPWGRRVASRTFTALINLAFGHRLHYYNGTCIYRTADLRLLTVRSTSFACLCEMLLKVLHVGRSYREVGIAIAPKAGRRSKAFRWRNVAGVCQAMVPLWYELRIQRRRARAPERVVAGGDPARVASQ